MPASPPPTGLPDPAQLVQAEQQMRLQIAANPRDAAAHHNLGAVLAQARRFEEAAESFRKAIEHNPSQVLSHHGLGIALAEMSDFDAAVVALRRAVEIDPNFLQAEWDLAGILNVAGRPDEALAAVDTVLAAQPGLVELRANRGTLLSRLGRYDEAWREFAGVVAERPDLAEAQRGLGMALRDLGRWEESVEALRRAVDLRPDWPDALFTLAAMLFAEDDPREAEDLLARALAVEPGFWMAAFHLGVIADLRGDDVAAAEAFSRVRATAPASEADAVLESWVWLKGARGTETAAKVTSFGLLGTCFDAARGDGLVLEFGVWQGASIRFLAAQTEDAVHGFDSFQGLPEAWAGEPKGSYSTHGALPDVPGNVTLHAGWFDKTLPKFLKKNDGPVRFVNVDCDTYGSTRTVFDALAPQIGPGTVLVFDEYFMYPGWQDGEAKAWAEAAEAQGWTYEILAYNLLSRQIGLRITG